MGRYIKEFKEIYPDVVFKVKNGNSDFIMEAIDNGLVDLGFVIEPIDLEKLNFFENESIRNMGNIDESRFTAS